MAVYINTSWVKAADKEYQASLYIGDGGILTAELYENTFMHLGGVKNIVTTKNIGDALGEEGYENVEKAITGNCDEPDRIIYLTTDGRWWFYTEYEPIGAPYLPIRVITTGYAISVKEYLDSLRYWNDNSTKVYDVKFLNEEEVLNNCQYPTRIYEYKKGEGSREYFTY